jgi:hypothetical protein
MIASLGCSPYTPTRISAVAGGKAKPIARIAKQTCRFGVI